jgi:formylglycine-generating enzyme required for sulfatase activity/serine/threonine protein kinase
MSMTDEKSEQSLGVEKTFQGEPKPKADDLEPRSLGDQATFAGGRQLPRNQSLGDQMTFGAGVSGDDALDDGMEVVDLSARYKVEKTLGKGGMGEVLLATDTRLERKVAIKRILGEAARSRTAINRFLTEAKSIAALNHPNIVQIYDYGRATDGPFLIMEFVDGESLLDRTRAGALPLEEAVELTCQLCDGLAKAHDAGIIHRDIKPANVLLSKDGIPKLTDFGLAKAETADTGMTMAGAVLGTLDFMPPEQRRDAALTDARSDLWSLAASLYQLVTGKSPKIIKFNDVPKALQEVLGKALEDSKDDRYQTARDLKQALKQALAAGTEVQLETGDCPHCGTKNETSRKFCKKCAQSLEVSCLSCKGKIPMWEEVCGNCGKQQSKLLEQRKQAMAAARAQAEQFLEEFEFAKAAGLAKQLGEEPDLRLRQLHGWSEKFAKQIEAAEREQLARVGELVSEALKHEQASDYPSAMQALEQIPSPLLRSNLAGHQNKALEILERVREKQAECKRLEKVIKQRIESRQLNGLLAEVEQLLQLRPDKSDALKLKQQLQEREAKLRQARDEAFATARQLAAGHDYEAALRELARIDDFVIEAPQQQFREELQAKLQELRQLQENINSGLTNKKYSGLLDLVEQFLELRPEEQSMLSLREQLKARDAKNEAAVRSVVDNANALRSRGDFAGAVGLLAKIPLELESIASHDLLEECSELADLRRQAIEGLQRGLANSQFGPALTGSGVYRDRIAGTGIADAEFIQLLNRCQTEKVESERLEVQRIRFAKALKIGSISAGVLALLGVVSYFVINSSMHSAAVKQALKAGNHEEVLRLDPRNIQGLALKAEAEAKRKAEAVSQAFEAGDYEEVLRLVPKNEDGLGLRAKAESILRALSENNFEEVLRVDPKNLKGLALKSKAETETKEKNDKILRALADGNFEELIRLEPTKVPAEAMAKISPDLLIKTPPIRNSIGLELKLLPPGTVLASPPKGGEAREISVKQPFMIGVFEVTEEQYERVMGTNPSQFKGTQNPVQGVYPKDAIEFCRRLSDLPEEKAFGRVYRLPSVAEWEYACRAGSQQEYCFGDDTKVLGEYAWYEENSKLEGDQGTHSHPVGKKKPNIWGLFDMHGNVLECCGEDPFQALGGAYTHSAERCKLSSSKVGKTIHAGTRSLLGFRIVAQFQLKSEKIALALAAGDYEEVLRLDASNSEGLALKAKTEAVSKALAAGDYEEVLRLDASNSEGLELKAKAVSKALAAGNYDEVLRLDASKLPAEAISKLPQEVILKLPQLKNSIGLELKLLPAGTFTMGDSEFKDATPHVVKLTRPFYLGVYEVTKGQYVQVMGKDERGRVIGKDGAIDKYRKYPAGFVSWEEAVEFCRKLSALPEEQAAGRVYRLPSEAEWEYACRAGSKTKYCFGDDESELKDYAWFGENSDKMPHPVGEKKPNAWGLYDMHGNFDEWCNDWYGDYPEGGVSDPTGPNEGRMRVKRGGEYSSYEKGDCDSAKRKQLHPQNRNHGFRVALSLPEIPK